MNEKKTFTGLHFGALPDFKDLVGCLIEEDNDEQLNTIQPPGCREFIFTEPRVLLSPCLENGKQAFVICKVPVLNCDKFKALMAKLQFKVLRKFPVTNELFQYCLAFTITQKLAPMWNKVGEYYIQGRDFFNCDSRLNAVSFDVNISDRLCIGLKAFNIKLHLAKAEHFCTSSNILRHFLTQSDYTIQQHSIQDDVCFVLPSLKKARVVAISHVITPDAPFPCYEDLRKHWKLMYGYRLPPDESVFYNVRFFGTKVFTYPASCIHSNYPHISPRCDQQAIFQAFLQDVQSRIPFICELPLRLTPSALYSSNKLHSAVNDNQSSLTRMMPSQFKHCTPFVFSTRQSQNQMPSHPEQKICGYAQSDPSSKQSQNITETSNRSTWNQPNNTSNHANATISTTGIDGFSGTSISQKQMPANAASVAGNNTNGSLKENSALKQNNTCISNAFTKQKFRPQLYSPSAATSHVTDAPVSNTPNTGPRIVPTFTKRVPQKLLFQRKNNGVSTPKVCPVFKSKVTASGAAQNVVAQSNNMNSTLGTTAMEDRLGSMQRHEQKRHTAMGRSDPPLNDINNQPELVTNGQVSHTVASSSNFTPVENNGDANRAVGHARKLPDVRPGLSLSRSAMNQRSHISGNHNKVQEVEILSKPSNSISSRGAQSRSINLMSSPRAQLNLSTTGTKNGLSIKPSMSRIENYDTSGSPSTVCRNTSPDVGSPNIGRTFPAGNMNLSSSSQGTPYKRQMGVGEGDVVTTKKPRSKPKVQDDVDARQLALDNQLKKVNTITLITWLKKRNVPVKQKDKKGELVEKVLDFIKNNVHEA